jgi:hypothetical protein
MSEAHPVDRYWLDTLPTDNEDGRLCCPRCLSQVFTVYRMIYGLLLTCQYCDTRVAIAVDQEAGVIVSGSGDRQFKLASWLWRPCRPFWHFP